MPHAKMTDLDQFKTELKTFVTWFTPQLVHLLSDEYAKGLKIDAPQNLMMAMRHGVLAGGKRLRPFLLQQTAKLFDVSHTQTLHGAAALEFIHCYSLIHDDLPCMDDDDLRRGNPTVHKAFDEATAILAGDGLLTFAFELLGDAQHKAETQIRLIKILAHAAGIGGMVGGQQRDLSAQDATLNAVQVLRMQSEKTGALLVAAFEMGAISGGANPDEMQRLKQFGDLCGRMYQLSDDMLDVTGTLEIAGKRVGKDEARGKKTLVALWGMSKAKQVLSQWHEEADALLEPFGDKAAPLRGFSAFMMSRQA